MRMPRFLGFLGLIACTLLLMPLLGAAAPVLAQGVSMGDSDVQFCLMLSTAFMPNMDIDAWYQQGTQEVWHTRCLACGELSDLSDPAGTFPDRSIAYNTGQVPPAPGGPPPPLNEYVWTCPHCRTLIPDPQLGRYVAQNPGADPKRRSFLLPRTISPRETPRKMFSEWQGSKTGEQKQSFYNRTLARPYIDQDQLPVTMAHCLAAVEQGRLAGVTWLTRWTGCYMGIDQMGGFNAVIIKRRLPDGRQALAHAEAVYDEDPFARCTELMKQYGVEVCVVDGNPNFNDARRFANAEEHRGRVFIASYTDMKDGMLKWSDDLTQSDRRTSEEDRTRYAVTIDRYKAMQTALFRVRNMHCLFPDPALLEQEVMDGKARKRVHLLRDVVFDHLTKTALVVKVHEETGKPRQTVLKVGLDPHFSFANMFCDVAWARRHGTGLMILPDMDPAGRPIGPAPAAMGMPGLPAAVAQLIEETIEGTCGRCANFDAGHCRAREFNTAASEPACFAYSERE